MISKFVKISCFQNGTAYFVGAGPGDVGLLTVRALYLLQNADIIVYDGLVNKTLLDFFPSVEKIYVEKKNSLSQQNNMNALLVRLAQKKKRVVCLKGGGSIIFGRGGNETAYLKKHNVSFEIIPEIAFGQATPIYTGIPVTDRRLASWVTFITAQENDKKKDLSGDWKKILQLGGNLIIYAEVEVLPLIVRCLFELGKNAQTLVSVIEGGSLPKQKVIRGTLENICEKIRKRRVKAPFIIVLGAINSMKEGFSWFDPKKTTGSYGDTLEETNEFARDVHPNVFIPKSQEIKHGGDIQAFAKEMGLREKDVYDFSSNINPIGIPGQVQEVYQSSMAEIVKYPDAKARQLSEKIATQHQIFSDNVLTGNGSIALIDLVIRSLKPKKALIIDPCFTEYRRLLQLSYVNINSIVLKEVDGFQFPFEMILDRLQETDLLVLGHPNNPTGTALSANQLVCLIEYANQRNKKILIDEAFIDWHTDESVLSYVREYSSLIVTRSLTKFYALAGIRAGYACAHKDIIDRMRMYQETWGCNSLAQKLSVAALNDQEFQTKSLDWFEEEHSFMLDSLSQISYIKVFPSRANFFLCKIIDPSSVNIFKQGMNSAGIYFRETHDFMGLDSSYFRIALKKRLENLYFLNVLTSIFKEKSLKYDRDIVSIHS